MRHYMSTRAWKRSIQRFVITENIDVKLGRRRNYHKGQAAVRHHANLRKPSDNLRFKLVSSLHSSDWQSPVVLLLGCAGQDTKMTDGQPPRSCRYTIYNKVHYVNTDLVLCTAPSVPQPVFTITEKAPTRAFSWLKAPTSAFTFKTLLRHVLR